MNTSSGGRNVGMAYANTYANGAEHRYGNENHLRCDSVLLGSDVRDRARTPNIDIRLCTHAQSFEKIGTMVADIKLYAEVNELKERLRQQVEFNRKLWDVVTSLSSILYAYDLHEMSCPRFTDRNTDCDCSMKPVDL